MYSTWPLAVCLLGACVCANNTRNRYNNYGQRRTIASARKLSPKKNGPCVCMHRQWRTTVWKSEQNRRQLPKRNRNKIEGKKVKRPRYAAHKVGTTMCAAVFGSPNCTISRERDLFLLPQPQTREPMVASVHVKPKRILSVAGFV